MPRPEQQPGVRLPGVLQLRYPLSRGALAVALVAASLLVPRPARGWGERMHEIINRRAAEAVPGPAADAWRPLAVALGLHASDADHRKAFDASEPPRHYIDIDVWDSPPFARVPRSLDELVRRHGRERAEQFGVVPWAIEECYEMVVRSLRRGDWGSAGAWAADLGHYVADSHQPLHCTVNYDGQNTGNRGVHLRFEVTMMDRYFTEEGWDIPPAPPADAFSDPVESCFGWIAGAYPDVATILAADDGARAADPDFGDAYYAALWEGSREVAVRHMTRAVRDLAGLYAAAWEEAGQPPPPESVPPLHALSVADLVPASGGPPGTSRGAYVAAGVAILGAFVLGAR